MNVPQERGTDPLVSVIVPAYNCARYITDAIESVLEQTYRNTEIVVVNDGSTDNLKEVLLPYRERGQIRYLYQNNSGPSTARNKGMEVSRGEYLSFLDADDLFHPEHIESVVAFMRDYPRVDFVFTNYEVFGEGKVSCRSGVDRWKKFRSIPHYTLRHGQWLFVESITKYIIRYGGFAATSCVSLRRGALEGIELFREGFFYGEDDDFFCRVNYRRKAGYIDRVLVRKREHGESLIHNRRNALRNTLHFIRLAELQREYYRDDPEIQEILDRKIPHLIFDYCWHLIDRKKFSDAQRMLVASLRQYRRAYPLYKLLAKNYVSRLYRRLAL
ncbi:MAG: glycosyltransferase family 2 protein [Alphaproteobacteria bacterium]|uniref:Glycosyltransferase family 2 protein n=1 Tax=Candidatus Nitrobium versatile TaxID=2884831 RepID=A0A953M0D6_9BACT|nr:glycosyltransferase family 2 protein [Candidatus Nitrobium versatile]